MVTRLGEEYVRIRSTGTTPQRAIRALSTRMMEMEGGPNMLGMVSTHISGMVRKMGVGSQRAINPVTHGDPDASLSWQQGLGAGEASGWGPSRADKGDTLILNVPEGGYKANRSGEAPDLLGAL